MSGWTILYRLTFIAIAGYVLANDFPQVLVVVAWVSMLSNALSLAFAAHKTDPVCHPRP